MTTNSKGNGIVMTGSHVFAVLLAVKVFSIENLRPPWRETLFLLFFLLPPQPILLNRLVCSSLLDIVQVA